MSKPVTFEAWAVVSKRGRPRVAYEVDGQTLIYHLRFMDFIAPRVLETEKLVKVRITMEVVDE